MVWKVTPEGGELFPPQRPPQKGYGTLGTAIVLTTNHFPVQVKNKDLVLYHYDVAIKDYNGKEMTPPLPKTKNMKIFEKLKESFPRVFKDASMSYDSGKNAYSPKLVPQLKKPQTYEVSLEPEEKKKEDGSKSNRNCYKVTLVNVNRASLKDLFDAMKYVPGNKKEMPSTIIQMIEVMFRHYRAKKYEQISNRNFFSVDEEFAKENYIGGGKVGVTGFFGSLRPSAWKDGSILLNLDMANTAFYKKMPVLDFMYELDDSVRFEAGLQPHQLRNFTKNLRGLKVKATYSLRTYKIKEIHARAARNTLFDFKDDKGKVVKLSVEQYFRDHYKIRLKYPNFNCLNVGNQNKDVFVPAELCDIDKGQKVRKKLSDNEVAKFIRSTAVPPAERLNQIKTVAKKNNFNQDEMLKALTFTISDVPLQTTGRVLPAPTLTMNRNNFKPASGVWDLRRNTFHKPAKLEHWAVINYDTQYMREDSLRRFISSLRQIGTEKGMVISEPIDIYTSHKRPPDPSDDFLYYKNNNPNIQLILCVLPGRKFYGSIKTAGDTVHNIITQCVINTNVNKCNPQTISNILLKINAKMGGINMIVEHIRDLRTGLINYKEAFMIMGADVNHPPAGGDSSVPSIAAVVGSYDPNGAMYAVERRVQEHRVENIVDMTEITMNLLKNFFAKTKIKPTRIIMYRDGVSESQFPQVLSKEMMAMRNACLTIQKDGKYTPGITFICVQKRHHTRLFCDEKYVQNQRNKNVPPGTIVDRDITHPTETDFFLCSHQGIQGTSKPTHYHLLWDDNDISIDELQTLTYKLCHVYSRCTRSVSIPTPVYYAHLAAFRAKVYATEILGGSESDSGSVKSGRDEVAEEQEKNRLRQEIREKANISRGMLLSHELHYI